MNNVRRVLLGLGIQGLEESNPRAEVRGGAALDGQAAGALDSVVDWRRSSSSGGRDLIGRLPGGRVLLKRLCVEKKKRRNKTDCDEGNYSSHGAGSDWPYF
ncbi:hypothetical protein GUJ93_ZPchr0006g44901 [Zizania palustris]|uniref:Uncharacterized protein n=1 Tax=Zizania palustris TaxID=103762 RepID=A0A8J5VVJ4_ZIZPA|nr:hypothetical protein GUJ93_ZPchr0006g44901 [Zizania palustris]